MKITQISNISIRELSKLFARYNFFSDSCTDKDMVIYGVLLDVYSSLTSKAKDELRWSYDIFIKDSLSK